MDLAYDQINQEAYAADRAATPTPDTQPQGTTTAPKQPSLNTELQETFQAFSNSPWAAKLGGLWGNVRKQAEDVRKNTESYYEEAKREVDDLAVDTAKWGAGLKESLASRTRALSTDEKPREESKIGEMLNEAAAEKERRESAARLEENDNFIARFRSEAAKRLKDIEKAEDAADEALLRFGTNIRNFLREAVAVAPPEDEKKGGEILFESKDLAGKRVLHTTRLDAQLHVIHTTPDKFTKDLDSEQWVTFKDKFKVEAETQRIAEDLEKYPELRKAMEGLVPEKVEYKDFWCRYYFLRHVLETEEQRRREMLKGASAQANDAEEVGWDEDSDEEEAPSTPLQKQPNDSTSTLQQATPTTANPDLLKPTQGRLSHDRQSQPDSEGSYDLVSGATSRAPGSPKEEKAKEKKDEDSDEEDWN